MNAWWRSSDGSSALKEVNALFKASIIMLLAVALLALLANMSTGSTRAVPAVVIGDAANKFSQTTHHAIVQLQNGNEIKVRVPRNTNLAPKQAIEINEHTSWLSDIPSYSYPVVVVVD